MISGAIERNPSPLLHDQGAGIVAGGDTLDFFKKYDRCKRPFAVSSQKRMYLDISGNVVHQEEMVQNMTSWDVCYYVLRANYDRVKSDYCDVPEPRAEDGEANYLYGRTFTGVAEEERLDSKRGGVRVSFRSSDGTEDSMFADLVIGADGPSSTVRKVLQKEVNREMAGYCALRGTIPEDEASAETKAAFSERFTFFHADGIQILAYLIPGKNGSINPGQRLMNFVWYYNFAPDSPELEDLMTDADGERHRITLPPGKMRTTVWEKMKQVASDRLPPQFAELIYKTKQPFVQAITDVISPRNSFLNGKVLLIGDALAGFRPHTVASTSQAAFNAMVLADMVAGKISLEGFIKETMQFARLTQDRGVKMGNRSQFGKDIPLDDHISDRNLASTPRQEEVYPKWTQVS